jgi:transcriptional regulator with GAF, ATPase, and Fis domain
LVIYASRLYSATISSKIIALAAAVEMLHTASLVHDDLIDGALLRRGIPTLNATWTPGATILTGDYLFARAAELAAQASNVHLMRRFAETLMVICSGELRQQLSDNEDQAVWGNSVGMRRISTVIEQVGDSDVAVLIRGESGVGKELVSRALHQQSTRRNRPYVKVNCAALPADLLESELFGHERGAFTGAATTRVGKFEQADGGTLMLDEIGELTPALQAKLLHVLQDGEFTKLGSNKRVQVDVRIVAATNRDLEGMMAAGTFREDLYYRLRVIELMVPALRDRRDEIQPLTESFVARYARKYRRPVPHISPRLRELFLNYEWPGTSANFRTPSSAR